MSRSKSARFAGMTTSIGRLSILALAADAGKIGIGGDCSSLHGALVELGTAETQAIELCPVILAISRFPY